MLTLRRGVGGLVAVLLMSGMASAQTSETADIAALRVRANAGDANAQYNLGNAYFNGRGVPLDTVEAVSWYRKAADQGLADAQFYLGVAYYYGRWFQQGHRITLL